MYRSINFQWIFYCTKPTIFTMPMLSRMVRTHLIYQFIILTLVFLGIGYYELLQERRFVMLLLVVPAFLYQLLILSCCTGMVTLPGWMNGTDSIAEVNPQEQSNGMSQPDEDGIEEKNKVLAMSVESKNLNNGTRDLKVSARKYKFRNWKASNTENCTLQSPTVSVGGSQSGKNEGFSLGFKKSGLIQRSESTKDYFFPYRQKRLEQWIEPKQNTRPFKIRNWQSINESSAKPASNVTPIKNLADSSVPENSVIPESELIKRYTFPFRQKHSVESDDNESDNNSAILSPTPYWRTVGYSLAVKQEARRRRRSVSSSLLSARQINQGIENDKSKDFSQSVEIKQADINDSRRNSDCSPFAKMKLGIVNCFSKIKRENSKTNLNKEFGSKKHTFKSMFQSRENIHLETLAKDDRSNSKSRNGQSNCDFYPSYIPFQKERFETDVRKRMLELPKN